MTGGPSHRPTPLRFQAVIFDCDGVLVDSESLGNQAIVEAVEALGVPLTLEEALAQFQGKKMAECVAKIEGWLGHSVDADFVPGIRSRMAELFRRQLQPVPGVRKVLEDLELPFCVASNGPREKIELSLRVTGLLPLLSGRVFSAYEVGSWKPAPGLFQHAARSLGVDPRECAVVEDSLPGVQAGLAAQMSVFAYLVEPSTEPPRNGVRRFDSMTELPTLLQMGGAG